MKDWSMYHRAVAWIVEEEDSEDLETVDDAASLRTVLLLAEMFEVPVNRAAEAVVAARGQIATS